MARFNRILDVGGAAFDLARSSLLFSPGLIPRLPNSPTFFTYRPDSIGRQPRKLFQHLFSDQLTSTSSIVQKEIAKPLLNLRDNVVFIQCPAALKLGCHKCGYFLSAGIRTSARHTFLYLMSARLRMSRRGLEDVYVCSCK